MWHASTLTYILSTAGVQFDNCPVCLWPQPSKAAILAQLGHEGVAYSTAPKVASILMVERGQGV